MDMAMVMEERKKSMKINKEFILREIAGEYIFVPVGATALEFNGLITINEIGVLIWKQLQEGSDLESIVSKVLDEYEIDEDTARKDVVEFIDYLKEKNIVED